MTRRENIKIKRENSSRKLVVKGGHFSRGSRSTKKHGRKDRKLNTAETFHKSFMFKMSDLIYSLFHTHCILVIDEGKDKGKKWLEWKRVKTPDRADQH